jgi:hypothetical protein
LTQPTSPEAVLRVSLWTNDRQMQLVLQQGDH